MKIAILSRNPKLYSTRRLVEAGKQRGHQVLVLNHKRCYMNITTMRPSIHYKGEAIEDVDAVIPRIGASVSFYGTAVVRQFETMGVDRVRTELSVSYVDHNMLQSGPMNADDHRYLQSVAARLAQSGVNIDYVYGSCGDQPSFMLVLNVDDREKAEKCLKG